MTNLKKVLVASKNTVWARDLKKALLGSGQVHCDIVTDRPDAIERVSATEYNLIVFENSFEIKNISVLLRCLDNSNGLVPGSIVLSIVDIRDLQKIEIPDSIVKSCCAYSVPLSVDIFCSIILSRFMDLNAFKEDMSQLDTDFKEIIKVSTSEVLSDFCSTQFSASEPTLLKDANPYPEVGIRSKIKIDSNFFKGSILVSFPNSTFLNIYEKVVGEKITTISDEESDFANSISNIIYGNLKKFLSEKGVDLDMVIPELDGTYTLENHSDDIYVFCFKSDLGPIYIKVANNLLD